MIASFAFFSAAFTCVHANRMIPAVSHGTLGGSPRYIYGQVTVTFTSDCHLSSGVQDIHEHHEDNASIPLIAGYPFAADTATVGGNVRRQHEA